MKYFIATVSTLICFSVLSQTTPSIQWQKALGGSGWEGATSIQQTADGGYIVAGHSSSNDGDVTGTLGRQDYWIVKIDANTNMIWQKIFGGSLDEQPNSIQQTKDGGYIVAGYSSSNDGDLTANHGKEDYWVIKLDGNGNKVWQKTFGGSSYDKATSVQQTTDGGYIVAGFSSSNDGDVTGNRGSYDYLVIKLDAFGNTIWKKTFGGSSSDLANSIRQTKDGGYIVAGYTFSNDGNVAGNHGDADCWILKLDASGKKVWQKALGGSFYEIANDIQQTADGGYIVAGYTSSNDGDVKGNHSIAEYGDYWVVKLDASGKKVWQKTLGGTSDEEASSIRQNMDGTYIVAGTARSNDGDVIGKNGETDYWVVKVDTTGNKLWQKTLGGSSYETASSIQQTLDGNYIVAGQSSSIDGDVTANHGSSDYWIVKLTDACPAPFISIRSSSDTSILVGNKVTFTANVTNGGTKPSYQWKKNGLKVGTNKKTYVDSTFRHGDSVYCVLTTIDSCAGTSTVKSNLKVVSVINPSIQWQKALGGSSYDGAASIEQTTDGGYIVAGWTTSYDGDVTGFHGGDEADYWIVKLDASGNKLWQKTLGGFSGDGAQSIKQTTDGGYIVAGWTESDDGDVTGNHGWSDYWIVKLDTNGNMVWQKTLGGSKNDEAASIVQTADGGFIVAGGTGSNDGDVTGQHGGTGIVSDYWIVKFNASGSIIWQKTLGGSSWDAAQSIQQTTDGGYIIAGYTNSYDGDVTGKHGSYDYWIVKLNANGNIRWQKALGGDSADVAYCIRQTIDGGYIVSGSTYSNDGDVTGHHLGFGTDWWIVKLDANGNIVWQKTLGSYNNDSPPGIQQTTDGGYIVAGYTSSNDGDVTGFHAGLGPDSWIVKLDAGGNMIWQEALGGSNTEYAQSIQQTTDGGYIVAAYTHSKDGDVRGKHGENDFWIVKLKEPCPPAVNISANPGTSVCTGSQVTFTANVTNGGTKPSYQWKKNGINVGTNRNTYTSSKLKTGDSIYCILTSNATCSTTPTAKSNYIIMTVGKPVTPKISIVASPSTSICAGSRVTFTATITNGGATPVYQWKKNGINVGTNSKTYSSTAIKNGDSIYCVLTSNAACATEPIVNSNGIKMLVNTCLIADRSSSAVLKGAAKELSVSATPNPFSVFVHLTVRSPGSTKATVLITAITGQTIYKQDVLLNSGNNVISVTSDGWSAGTYFVQAATNTETRSCKIVKE